jgi:tripartite-type tricarboxylate transporter receptor subunit TctC
MRVDRQKLLGRAALLIVGLFSATSAQAQPTPAYPTRALRLIVPIAPGGGMDTTARVFATKLHEALGQPVIVDNRPGAGGLIGMEAVLKAPADGYTLVVATISTLVMIPATQGKPAYDLLRDFAPITLMSTVPYELVSHPSLPARTLAQLVALARTQPGHLSYGSAGYVTGTHLAAEYFASVAGIQWTHVPYKGAAPAMIDMLAGQVPLSFVTASSAQPYVIAGRARGLGVASAKRLATLPDLPTIAESGYAGFQAESWLGIAARSGTPLAILAKLHGDIVRVLSSQEVRASIESHGNVVATSTPEAFSGFIGSETGKWKKVIERARIRID